MATEIARLYATVGANTKNFDKNMAGVKKELGVVGKSFGGLKTAVAGLGVAFGAVGAVQLGSMVVDMARAGAESQQLRLSFDRLAEGVGESGNAMLQSMQRASRGMVSDTDLVLAANKAMLLGVADSGEELAQLLDVAAVRGQAMGLSLTQAFNDIVTGIGRMSPMILDNLGIVTGGQKVFDDYAAQINKAADALTDAEKKQALLNKVISDTKGMEFVESAANDFERMDAAIQNAKSALGELFAPAIAVIAGKLAESVSEVTDALTEPLSSSDGFWAVMLRTANATVSNTETAEELAAKIRVLQDEYDALGQRRQEIGALDEAFELLGSRQLVVFQLLQQAKGRYAELRQEFEQNHNASMRLSNVLDELAGSEEIASREALEFASNLDIVGMAANDASTDVDMLARSIRELSHLDALDVIMGVSGEAGAQRAWELYDDANRILEFNLDLWRQQGLTEDEILRKRAALVSTLQDSFSLTEKAATETSKWAAATSNVSNAYNSLRSRVSSVIQGAIGPVAGVNATDLLPREDAINENARRLADIAVNGLRPTEWLDEFKAEVPGIFQEIAESGDPRRAAAEILKRFQMGLEPGLIDKNLAAEIVANAIRGDQATDALIDDVARQVANDLNVSLGEATAAAQEVLGGAEGTTGALESGESAGTAYGEGLRSSLNGMGATITNNLATQLKAENNLDAVKSAGNAQGMVWGNGFLATVGENVPGQLINILVNLVTPGVLANINTINPQLNGATN